jgi:hypothetical protein
MPRKTNTKRSPKRFSRAPVSLVHIRVKTSPLAQYTSGVGALSAGSSVTSKYLDPYEVGGRFGSLAAFWQQYRIKSGRLTYEPFGSSSGFVSDVTGGTASATAIVAERDFAWILLPDPDVSLTTSDQILDSGGIAQNSSRRGSVPVKPTLWLWTSTDVAAAAPPSGADYRMVCFGRHAACFTATSTTAARTYGQFVLDLWVEFRHEHTQVSVIGSSLSPAVPGVLALHSQKTWASTVEEEKDQKSSSTDLLKNSASCSTGTTAKGWF